MKKILLSICSLLLLAGMSGCVGKQNKQLSQEQRQKQQQREKENKANEKAMLSYLRDKYKQEFTSIQYTPAKRGFNDGFNENTLTAESEDGIRVNVKEKLVYKGEFYDDFLNYYASDRIKDTVDYSGIKNLQTAKTFVTLKPDYNKLNVVESEDFKLSIKMINSRYCVIAVSGEPDDQVLQQLYSVYQKANALGYGHAIFDIAFGGEKRKSEKYINNYLLYASVDWELFDDSIKSRMVIYQEGLSFKKFKDHLVKLKADR